MTEQYELIKECRVFPMHDERIKEMIVGKETFTITFNELDYHYNGYKNCSIVFGGFEGMEYDIRFTTTRFRTDLTFHGKQYNLSEFVEFVRKLEEPFMEVVQILTGYGTAMINGYLLEDDYQTACSIIIDCKTMTYKWN